MSNKIEVDFELFRDLADAAGWVNGFYMSLNNGETREYHPDWNAVEYLASEALLIEQRGRAILEATQESVQLTGLRCPVCGCGHNGLHDVQQRKEIDG